MPLAALHTSTPAGLFSPQQSDNALARGYQSFWTAWRILEGIEAVHMIRKGRVRWVAKGDSLAQMQFINELFGLAI